MKTMSPLIAFIFLLSFSNPSIAQEPLDPAEMITVVANKDLKMFISHIESQWPGRQKTKQWPLIQGHRDYYLYDSVSNYWSKQPRGSRKRDLDAEELITSPKGKVYRFFDDKNQSQLAQVVRFNNGHFQFDYSTLTFPGTVFLNYMKNQTRFPRIKGQENDTWGVWEGEGLTISVSVTDPTASVHIYYTAPK